MKPEPSVANSFLAAHVRRLRDSHRRWTGRELGPELASEADDAAVAESLYRAPFVVLSHDTAEDPVFNYANLTAQRLFACGWAQITALPSRFSAEPLERGERARLLAAVAAQGFIDDYRGVRVASTGARFWIERATVWNVVDAGGTPLGQAATFSHWTPLPSAGPPTAPDQG